MNVEKENLAGDVAVLRCDGRLNLATAPSLRASIEEATTPGRSRLIVDLSNVVFIDSSGLGALIAGVKLCRQTGGEFRIVAVGDQVLTALRLTKLDRILHPYPAVEAARDGW